MITVSASAVRIPFGIAAQVHWYPTDARFVLVVIAVGTVVVGLAMAGFKKLAAFSSVCSPWMFLMFVAGAVVALPHLAQQAGLSGVSGPSDFFTVAERVVWTGRTPDGSAPMGFWRIAAFAWICNLAMHGGLSDMALFRYARHSWYGLITAVGMFFGHYVAWICAGMMGAGAALLLQQPLARLDSGAVAYTTIGWAGIFAVVAAGWTTSNPTLYRAGLALQAITPNWSRARVTLIAGIATTLIACFPFVFTRLLDFVGLYGLLLAPAGAVVLTEHWIFPRLGLTQYWAYHQGKALNWPALWPGLARWWSVSRSSARVCCISSISSSRCTRSRWRPTSASPRSPARACQRRRAHRAFPGSSAAGCRLHPSPRPAHQPSARSLG